MWDILAAVLCSIFMLVGIIGSILPLIPGLPLAYAGFFIYAAVTGFEKISLVTALVFLAVTLATMAIGYFAPMLGAKKHKASLLGIIGAFIGLTLGVLVFGFWGIIIGPFLGALLGELISNREPQQALKSAVGTLVGFIAGTLLQIVVILIMAGFFVSALF